MKGEDLIKICLKARRLSAYQLSKMMGESRQNYTRLLTHKRGSDIKFEKADSVLHTLGYRIKVEDTGEMVAGLEYLDYVAKRGRPKGTFVCENEGERIVLHNIENDKSMVIDRGA